MNTIKLAFCVFFKKGQNNIIKIISLGVGLTVGLLLLSKVSFDQNFDNFYPDADRIYSVATKVQRQNEDSREYGQVSGGIAPGLKTEIAEVEAATRFTGIGGVDAVFYTSEKKRLTANFIIGDSCLFDVLPRPVIIGYAKEVLSRPMYAMVSKSVANKIGGNVIDQQIEIDTYPGIKITIGGVFEDIPENSINKYDVVISMASIGQFIWDGSEYWLGNDRYQAFVRLRNGVDAQGLSKAIRLMQEKYQDIERVEQENKTEIQYVLKPLATLHSDRPEVQRMSKLLLVLAFALIFTAVMNYLLVVISSLPAKARNVAVNKCYGASEKDIAKQMIIETVLHMLLSLILSVLLVLVFKGIIEHLLSVSVSSLINIRSSILLSSVCALVFLIAAIVPSFILSRVPVATVFRMINKSRKGWKMVLLFVQFVASTFLMILVVTVSKQYSLMVNDNPGYNYQNVLYVSTSGIDMSKRLAIIENIKQQPQVQRVALASELPIWGLSGNNISLPDENQELFNIADLYFADSNFLPLMEIPIVEGENFNAKSSPSDILVSKSFLDKIKTTIGWDDVLGKDVVLSGHGLCHIIGVYSDIRLGSISDEDKRASVISHALPGVRKYVDASTSIIIVKLQTANGDNIRGIEAGIKNVVPDKYIQIFRYADSITKLYNKENLFRQAIVIGGIVVILITLIGLVGYVNNEIMRRTSEIAIRKINGATLCNILSLFVKDVALIALPASLIGAIAAYLSTELWIQNFSVKASFSPLLYGGCAIVILLLIEFVVVINCIKIANQNPVNSLKTV